MNGEKTTNGVVAAGALGQLCGRFEQWRQQAGRGRRRRIPESFWDEATQLARHHGVFRVARTLRLDYSMLKKRAGIKTGRLSKSAPMPFVELMMPGPVAASESVIELTNRKGVRMTIRLHPHCGKDMIDLAEMFLRQPK